MSYENWLGEHQTAATTAIIHPFHFSFSYQQKKRICSNWVDNNILHVEGVSIPAKRLHNRFKKDHNIEIKVVSCYY